MALPVRAKAVKKERTKLRQRPVGNLKPEARAAPTITAKPIIMQFTGLISLANPLGEPMISTTRPSMPRFIKVVRKKKRVEKNEVLMGVSAMSV